MMGRVGLHLIVHEFIERLRDRWVIASSLVFALLASAVSAYGITAGANAVALTGPSLATLVSLLVPLVAMILSHDAIVGERERNTLGLLLSLAVRRWEVIVAKYIGRGAALAVSVCAGLGLASVVAGKEQGAVLLQLIPATLLLGWAFLAIGMLISSISSRPVSASTMVVIVWFVLVFFFDLALLGLLVATDGYISTKTISNLVIANPAGLYRIQVLSRLSGAEALANLGMTVAPPSGALIAFIWGSWIVGPLVVSWAILSRRRVR
ncbi:MAG: ABC transporter permease subunit [Myxococcales bacterium]|nr:ABC transporter permease subunit [Myxococcales bacterium]